MTAPAKCPRAWCLRDRATEWCAEVSIGKLIASAKVKKRRYEYGAECTPSTSGILTPKSDPHGQRNRADSSGKDRPA